MPRPKKTKEHYISLASIIHNNKYSYYKVTEEYPNPILKYTFTCNDHGDFDQSFNNHISHKNGCPTCGKIQRKKTFIDKYGVDNPQKNKIIQEKTKKTQFKKYNSHAFNIQKQKNDILISKEEVKKLLKIHTDNKNKQQFKTILKNLSLYTYKYIISYSNTFSEGLWIYLNSYNPLCVICYRKAIWNYRKKEFYKTCSECKDLINFKNHNYIIKKYIKKSKKIHGEKYDYSKSIIPTDIKRKSIYKVIIICSEHGEFLQCFNNHTNKSKPQGCPDCAKEKMFINNPSFCQEIIEKRKRTCQKKYGGNAPACKDKIKEKILETRNNRSEEEKELEKQNRKNVWLNRSEEENKRILKARQKGLENLCKKYNVSNPIHIPYIKEKIREKIDSGQIQEKYKQTCLERYGVENAMQNSEIFQKQSISAINNNENLNDLSEKELYEYFINEGKKLDVKKLEKIFKIA